MFALVRRRLTWAVGAAGLAAMALGCGTPASGPTVAERYLDSAAWRRGELEASLVNPTNRYSSLRLAHYASGDAADWDRLPEWNPLVELIAPVELDGPRGASTTTISPAATALVLPDGIRSEDDPRLLSLGRDAFRRYPVQLSPQWRVALTSRAAAAHYGLWVDDARAAVGGIVRARMADGSAALMVTCSTCHAAASGGETTDGLPNAGLDSGAALLDVAGPGLDPGVAAAIAAWGPGRLDVTTGVGSEPARLPDLRPAHWLTYLQQDATVRVRNLASLAIRIETLIIVSHNEVTRPPRVVVLAIAAYLASLGATLPTLDAAERDNPRGAELFAAHCSPCHATPGLTGEPSALAVVGTDPTLGVSSDRGTGTYRVPSLHGVGTRGPLLHDGTVPSLAAMLDPARLTPAYPEKLHGAGPVPGHPFGLDLDATDRAALVGFLARL
jgi:mono/diheme cytochrome c family protein